MIPLKPSLVLILSLAFVILSYEVMEADSFYAYAVKGIVKDVRLHPRKFIGGWFFKKALILKKLKIAWILKKKFILKKLLKKLLLIGLRKVKGGGTTVGVGIGIGFGFSKPRIVLPVPPPKFAYGWGPVNYWTHLPLSHFRRRKRSIRFPDDSQDGPTHEVNNRQHFQTTHNSQSYHSSSDDDYFKRYDISSLDLSQSDLDQLKKLPNNLKFEYGQEMERLEASASEPKEEVIQDYFTAASEFDNGNCIPRSICEIMSKGNYSRTPFENEVLEYYNDPAGVEKRAGTPAYIYDYAAYLGKSTRDARVCGQHFSSCQDSREALNMFMNEVFTPESCDKSSPVFSSGGNQNSNSNRYSSVYDLP